MDRRRTKRARLININANQALIKLIRTRVHGRSLFLSLFAKFHSTTPHVTWGGRRLHTEFVITCDVISSMTTRVHNFERTAAFRSTFVCNQELNNSFVSTVFAGTYTISSWLHAMYLPGPTAGWFHLIQLVRLIQGYFHTDKNMCIHKHDICNEEINCKARWTPRIWRTNLIIDVLFGIQRLTFPLLFLIIQLRTHSKSWRVDEKVYIYTGSNKTDFR